MSLLVCSSAQDKYNVRGFKQVGEEDLVTQQNAMGLQNPASFTNNINPVFRIKANSEVCLKSANYNRSGEIKIGNNESFALYVGEELRTRWGGGIDGAPDRSLNDTTSFPIPIPLQPGTYNMRAFSTMVNKMLDWYISYPDLFNNIWVEPANVQNDGTNKFGLVFSFTHGNSGLNDSKYAMIDAKAWKGNRNNFSYGVAGLPGGVVQAAQTYQTPILTTTGYNTNSGIIENIPLSLRGGEMKWTTSGADSGWRIGLTRPTVDEGPPTSTTSNYRLKPNNFSGTWFFDYCVEYDTSGTNTIRLWHSVIQNGVMEMREVEYYNNTSTDFAPVLSSDTESRDLTSMYRGSHLTGAILGSDPKTISIKFYGEDTVVAITNAADDVFILTDSRLCLNEYGANPVVIAQTPTRNRFFKPVGLTTCALYPKVELTGSTIATKEVTLSVWNGITIASEDAAERLANTDYTYPQPWADGEDTSEGSSFWGRSQLHADHGTGRIADLVDEALPYQSDSAEAQKQYVGLSGPEGGALVPPRYQTGNPEIPITAVDEGAHCPVAYGLGLILIGSNAGLTDSETPGVYVSDQTDVSAAFGFPDKDSVFQSRNGSSYIFSDRNTKASTTPPTNTVGAFYGWYFGSDVAPIFTRGTLFIRVPQLTHQSYNFGKGIPSKIIGQLPHWSAAGGVREGGERYWEPSNLTYLDLNNPADMNINDLTIEIVDKTEEVVTDLTGSTTIVLHIKEK
jgi:hypothetical protein